MCRLAIAAVRYTTKRGQLFDTHTRTEGKTNHLVFRTFSVENGQEELTVSVLTFGELESGKDLSKRWRCCLCDKRSDRGRHTHTEGYKRTCSSILQEESISCWGCWTVELIAGEERVGEGEEDGEEGERGSGGGLSYMRTPRFPSISTPRVGEKSRIEKPKPSSAPGM